MSLIPKKNINEMDPLSIAASIAGLVGLSCEISYIVQEYYSSAKNASKDIKNVQNELEALSDVLKRLEYMLRNDREVKAFSAFSSSSVLVTALQACHEQIKEISAKLKSSKHGSDCRIWERLKWPFSEKDVKKMLDAIRRFTLTFQFSLTVDGW